eukprot:GHVU01226406.1.p1 GENE.GHVU01226406.1~~GHVU01226406.1.p1  ORF type:complete len:104 (-),score=7.64 GHVU01226406.1:615-926(-)
MDTREAQRLQKRGREGALQSPPRLPPLAGPDMAAKRAPVKKAHGRVVTADNLKKLSILLNIFLLLFLKIIRFICAKNDKFRFQCQLLSDCKIQIYRYYSLYNS